MSESAPNPLDPLTQLLQQSLPENVEDMRKLLDGFAAMMNAGLPEVGATHDAVPVEGAGPGVTADVVVPRGDGPHPVLVYLHGGGWVCGSPATHRKLGHRFAEAGYLVFNVDYRLAPEHPFPAPYEDCVAAVRWAARAAGRYGGDPERIALGGDSAGGNLSAATAVALADDPDLRLAAALLIYGVFDFAKLGTASLGQMPGAQMLGGQGPSAEELAEAGEKMVEMMVGSYLGPERPASLLSDPRVSPIHGAERLPPSCIVCGTADPLVEQTHTLAQTLDRAGVAHEKVIVDAMPHGFVQMEFFPQARQSIDRMVAFLDRHLR